MMDESGVFLMTKPIKNPTQELEGLRHDFEVQQYELEATLKALKWKNNLTTRLHFEMHQLFFSKQHVLRRRTRLRFSILR